MCDACATLLPKHRKVKHALKYTHDNDCSDDCTPGTERALSLRFQTQIQALLSVEGRRRRERRARPGCVPESRSVNGVCCYDANPATKDANGSALEGEDGSWIYPARARSSQGRRELGNLGSMAGGQSHRGSNPRFRTRLRSRPTSELRPGKPTFAHKWSRRSSAVALARRTSRLHNKLRLQARFRSRRHACERRPTRYRAVAIIEGCTSASLACASIARRYTTPTAARSAHRKRSDSSSGGSMLIRRRGMPPRRRSPQMPPGSTAIVKCSIRNPGDPERRRGFAAEAS